MADFSIAEAVNQAFQDHAIKYNWSVYIPPIAFTTDNAAMIAMAGHYKYKSGIFGELKDSPLPRMSF